MSFHEKTSKEHMALIDKMFADNENLLQNLYARWLSEKDYEDIKDYRDVIVKNMPEGIVVTKMNKRPFGFNFNVGTGAEYCVFVKPGEYGWKRIK